MAPINAYSRTSRPKKFNYFNFSYCSIFHPIPLLTPKMQKFFKNAFIFKSWSSDPPYSPILCVIWIFFIFPLLGSEQGLYRLSEKNFPDFCFKSTNFPWPISLKPICFSLTSSEKGNFSPDLIGSITMQVKNSKIFIFQFSNM